VNPWAIVAVTGPEVSSPGLVRTNPGSAIAGIINGRVGADRHLRVISGNVLTGTAVGADDAFLHFPYRQITVIDEGDDVDEFMGWASMKPSKLSVSAALPFSRFTRMFSPDARLNGGRRAMIMSGEYDRVLPMDIMPEFLLKAIIGRNIEEMEALGIYEIAPEDMALCEFVDTSKLPIQQIVRDGLDYLRGENE
ncbi:MAG: NADH:ubiquinone reductase (Na(+)-transporting) subunit A, partial [Muribaculaceae bacterium]|nr:NADH:ubiquinone reductase (Na(+)-transporting) subunit A [Muribaculaceae bacterium]